MIHINVANSPTAKRVGVIFCCPNPECGHESFESLVRFHGRYKMACMRCGSAIDLYTEENRRVIEELAEFCLATDARIQKGD